MLTKIIGLLTKTVARMKFPYNSKKFNLRHFEDIKKELRKDIFAPILVTTYGFFGANFLIRFAQWLGVYKWTNKTHVAIWIGEDRVIEAVSGEGIREVSLLEAIGQRDEVKIMRSYVNDKINQAAWEYAIKILCKDQKQPILYDNAHNVEDISAFDCSEVFYHSMNYGLKSDNFTLISPIKRLGRKTYTPMDVEFCRFLRPIYDSKRGGFITVPKQLKTM